MRLPIFVAALVATRVFAAEPLGLSEAEFKMFRHANIAMEDARVQKMKPEARLGAIAKDAGFKLGELKKAMEKGEAAGDLKAKCEAGVKEVVDAKEFAGRISKVEVNLSAEHAVAYVQWLNEDLKALPYEACLLAARAADGCAIVSTFQVWAQDKANPKARVFQALVSASAAHRINQDKAKDFAETRYLKLFEKVKSAANGDDLSGESGTPSAKP